MSPKLKAIEDQVLQLPAQERAQLAERLLSSLEEVDTIEAEKLWAEEAERRYREYKKGKIRSALPKQCFVERVRCSREAPRIFHPPKKKRIGRRLF